MKKLVILLSVVAVSFALQAGDGTCSKDKTACNKSKTATGEKIKVGTCNKGTAEAKGSCPASKKAGEAASKPVQSPKASS
ncbi:MAG TPA: hypothetical protein P5205_17380 [Candidatus Paceibacterota bacterium]|nr:hypothetical protein [Candidatus Paceibacterota bacterium]